MGWHLALSPTQWPGLEGPSHCGLWPRCSGSHLARRGFPRLEGAWRQAYGQSTRQAATPTQTPSEVCGPGLPALPSPSTGGQSLAVQGGRLPCWVQGIWAPSAGQGPAWQAVLGETPPATDSRLRAWGSGPCSLIHYSELSESSHLVLPSRPPLHSPPGLCNLPLVHQRPKGSSAQRPPQASLPFSRKPTPRCGTLGPRCLSPVLGFSLVVSCGL